MCYVHNQQYDISCTTLYLVARVGFSGSLVLNQVACLIATGNSTVKWKGGGYMFIRRCAPRICGTEKGQLELLERSTHFHKFRMKMKSLQATLNTVLLISRSR